MMIKKYVRMHDYPEIFGVFYEEDKSMYYNLACRPGAKIIVFKPDITKQMKLHIVGDK